MATLTDRIASLSANERSKLMAKLFEARGATAQAARSDIPRLRTDNDHRLEPFPLTELQEAYWVGRGGDFNVGDVSAHSYWEFENDGLDIARLEEAWGRLIRRHEALRLIFLPDAQQQVLGEVPAYSIRVIDLSKESEKSAEGQIQALREDMSHQVLRSDQWPLFDIRCARLPKGKIRLFFSFDGLILDSWSMGILFKELSALYLAPEIELKTIGVSFRDCVLASIDAQKSAAYETSRAYWRERLGQLPPAPELPGPNSQARRARSRFTRRTARFGPEVWGRLQQRAADAGTTSIGLLLAAYAEVIGYCSRQSRFTLNVPLFNRLPLHPDINAVVGEFASFTLLEVDNRGDDGFGVRAKRLQERLWADLNHTAFSGVAVLRELVKRNGLGSRSAMPIVFTSLCDDRTALEGSHSAGHGVLGKKVFSINQTPQVWLDNHVSGADGALICEWDSIDDLFAEGCTESLFDAYCRLLHLLATNDNCWSKTGAELGRMLESARPGSPRAAQSAPAANTGTIAQISRIVCHVLELPQVNPTESLLALGANSIDFVRISNRLEKELGFRPRMEDLFRLQSVAALAEAFDAQSNEGRLSSDAGVTNASDTIRARLASYKILLDPGERERFKSARAGVRRDIGSRSSIELGKPALTDQFAAGYRRRRSYRLFQLQPIRFDQFAGFLTGLYDARINDKPKFLYASPGGLNPTQVYLHIKAGRIQGISGGTYYYHPEDHRLVALRLGADIDRSVHLPFINQPIFDEAAFSLFLVADLDAIGPAYGERSLHYVTLEAGIIAHHLEVWGPDHGIGLCQIGAMDFEKIRSHFDLGASHVFVHSLLGGMIPPVDGRPASNITAASDPTASEKVTRLIQRIKGLSESELKELLSPDQNSPTASR